MKDESGYGAGSVFLSFLLGGIVGAGAALLLAPQSGRETRQKIREFADEIKDKVGDSVEKGKDFFEERKTVLSAAIEAGQKAYENEKKKFKG
ncbi:MAG: YtxH domain-containing protein [Nitrospiraceae bacterium]|nr:YtxH domain-containing protein [Nitrospiraceae bacterium]